MRNRTDLSPDQTALSLDVSPEAPGNDMLQPALVADKRGEDDGLLPSSAKAGREVVEPEIFPADESGAMALLAREAIAVRYITDAKEAVAAVGELAAIEGSLGLDIETAMLPAFASDAEAGLDPHLSRIRLVQCYAGGNTVFIFDVDAVGLTPLAQLWTARLVAHNAVFELKHLMHAGTAARDIDCTMLQANALEGELPSLAELARRHLGWDLKKELQTSDWSRPLLTPAQLAYAALDAVAVHRIATLQCVAFARLQRVRPYLLMKNAQRAIAELELNGVHFDRDAHAELCEMWEDLLREREQELTRMLGPRLNPNSSKQLAEWLARNIDPAILSRWPKTQMGQLKTDADTLRQLADHPLVVPLVAYKDARKRVSVWGKAFAEHIHPVTGRIHPHFLLGGTATGRLSCSQPNLQNIPRERAFRALFSAPPGRVLVVADYSQIELRVTALVSRDPAMLRAYARGEDLHKKTASAIARVPLDEVTAEQRHRAKAVNFGLLYGMGAAGLARSAAANYGVTMTERQAMRAREAFFATYRGFRYWQRKTAERAERTMKVVTPAGRVRDFRKEDRGYQYTEALNTPIQGGAAEVMLAALGKLPNMLSGLNARLVNVVHDEIVVEVTEQDAPAAKAQVEKAMITAMSEIFPGATTRGLIDTKIGLNWSDAK